MPTKIQPFGLLVPRNEAEKTRAQEALKRRAAALIQQHREYEIYRDGFLAGLWIGLNAAWIAIAIVEDAWAAAAFLCSYTAVVVWATQNYAKLRYGYRGKPPESVVRETGAWIVYVNMDENPEEWRGE